VTGKEMADKSAYGFSFFSFSVGLYVILMVAVCVQKLIEKQRLFIIH
jgi:hypothetical protein